MEFEKIQLSHIQDKFKQLDDLFAKLHLSIDTNHRGEMEYLLYSTANVIADQKRVYRRNSYKLSVKRDELFTQYREENNSDLATTKKINKMLLAENTEIDLQEHIVEWLEDKLDIIRRFASHINDRRIQELADQKRMVVK